MLGASVGEQGEVSGLRDAVRNWTNSEAMWRRALDATVGNLGRSGHITQSLRISGERFGLSFEGQGKWCVDKRLTMAKAE